MEMKFKIEIGTVVKYRMPSNHSVVRKMVVNSIITRYCGRTVRWFSEDKVPADATHRAFAFIEEKDIVEIVKR